MGVRIPVPSYMVGNLSLSKVKAQGEWISTLIYDAPGEAELAIVIARQGKTVNWTDIQGGIDNVIEKFRSEGLEAWRITIGGWPGVAKDVGRKHSGYYSIGHVWVCTDKLRILIMGDYPASELLKVAESMGIAK